MAVVRCGRLSIGAETRLSQAGRAALVKAVWNGQPRRNFHFKDFNAQMKAAFDEFALLNEHVANHVQVETYLDAIVDPKVSVAKATAVAHATMQDSFEEASHYGDHGPSRFWDRETRVSCRC
jgi:hypothetical protein